MGSPTPATGALEEHLVACVQQSLGLYLFDNASFLCERLVAQFPSEVGPNSLTFAGRPGCRQLLPWGGRPAAFASPGALTDCPAALAPWRPVAGQPLPAGQLLPPLQPVVPCVPPAQGPGRRAVALPLRPVRHAAGQADGGGDGAAARQRRVARAQRRRRLLPAGPHPPAVQPPLRRHRLLLHRAAAGPHAVVRLRGAVRAGSRPGGTAVPGHGGGGRRGSRGRQHRDRLCPGRQQRRPGHLAPRDGLCARQRRVGRRRQQQPAARRRRQPLHVPASGHALAAPAPAAGLPRGRWARLHGGHQGGRPGRHVQLGGQQAAAGSGGAQHRGRLGGPGATLRRLNCPAAWWRRNTGTCPGFAGLRLQRCSSALLPSLLCCRCRAA